MYEVPFCLFENVGDLVEDAQDENLIAMIRLLKEAGCACSYRKTCASRSMMPQRRGRVYFIAINWRRCRRTFEEAKSITDEAMIIVAHLEGLNILRLTVERPDCHIAERRSAIDPNGCSRNKRGRFRQ